MVLESEMYFVLLLSRDKEMCALKNIAQDLLLQRLGKQEREALRYV